MDETPTVIVNPQGKPARAAVSADCPRCGAGPQKRVKSGWGDDAHPVCNCGYEFLDEVWRG